MQGDEGALEASLVLEQAMAEGLRDLQPGSEILVLTWRHEASRHVPWLYDVHRAHATSIPFQNPDPHRWMPLTRTDASRPRYVHQAIVVGSHRPGREAQSLRAALRSRTLAVEQRFDQT